MATLIGLCIRTQLLRSLPPAFKFDISVRSASNFCCDCPVARWQRRHLGCTCHRFRPSPSPRNPSQITEGGHASRDAVNKQLNDKERVAAALENPNLLKMVEQCLSTARSGASAVLET